MSDRFNAVSSQRKSASKATETSSGRRRKFIVDKKKAQSKQIKNESND